MLRSGSSSGWCAPPEALVVRSHPGGGPVGRGAGRLRRREARHGVGGHRPGQSQQNQKKHAGHAAPQRLKLLSKCGGVFKLIPDVSPKTQLFFLALL